MLSRYLFTGCVAALLIAAMLVPTADAKKGKPGGGDTTAPDAIDDLSAAPAALGGVELTFTAVGDDGGGSTCSGAGQASSYDIRYSTSPIDDDTDFDAATQVSDVRTPGGCGNTETIGVCGLSVNTTYYVAMKVLDEAGNASGLSNLASSLPGDALGNYVHIHDVGIGALPDGGWRRLRRAGVYIRDEYGVPVVGATVWGLWTGDYPSKKGATSVVTDCLGFALFEGGSVQCRGAPVLEFTVTDVTHPTAQYDPTADVETSTELSCY